MCWRVGTVARADGYSHLQGRRCAGGWGQWRGLMGTRGCPAVRRTAAMAVELQRGSRQCLRNRRRSRARRGSKMPRHNDTHVGNAAATAHSRALTRRSMAMCAADGLRRQWFRREPIFVAKAAEDLVARAGEHCLPRMNATSFCRLVHVRSGAAWAFLSACLTCLYVCVRACVRARSRSAVRTKWSSG